MNDDLVKRLREGVFGSDETKTDAVIHSHMQRAANEIETQAARIAELEAQNKMLRHATDKLRDAITALKAKHEPMKRAFVTAVELLNDAALKGKDDESVY